MDARYGRISAPWWDEVWIVAGGPSARRFDFSQIPPACRVLAVNDGVDHLRGSSSYPLAAAVVSIDQRWIRRRRVFLEHVRGEKFLAVPLDTWPECAGIPGATYLQWSHASGLSDDPGFLATGGNSGYAALNLAYLKHARLIHLVGYDMNPRHDEKYEHWAPRFHNALAQLGKRGVTVLNHNPDSYVDAFPRVYGVGCPA